MNDIELAAFQEEVARHSHVLFHYDSRGQRLNALPRRRKSPPGGTNLREKSQTLDEILASSSNEIEKWGLRKILCGYLTSATSDLTSVSKIVAATLVPLSLTGKIQLPLDPWIYAGVAFIVFHATVDTFCGRASKEAAGKKDE